MFQVFVCLPCSRSSRLFLLLLKAALNCFSCSSFAFFPSLQVVVVGRPAAPNSSLLLHTHTHAPPTQHAHPQKHHPHTPHTHNKPPSAAPFWTHITLTHTTYTRAHTARPQLTETITAGTPPHTNPPLASETRTETTFAFWDAFWDWFDIGRVSRSTKQGALSVRIKPL